ncbi:abortive infection protein [Oxynema sp. CENA135]|uniref:abortive infection protein n=1 Tax=Oxynema sp. CENA135 TaxID=984206 RepID=UPI00190E3B3B|nr:abortive infection protein [Oxynema sp. CENA135]MBK4731159.1 abortive infection protein [Oxynema sp. CENA135]
MPPLEWNTLLIVVALLGLTAILMGVYRRRFYIVPKPPFSKRPPPIAEDDVGQLLDRDNLIAAQALYQPIAPWTGRLILPTPDRRQPDGAIAVEVHNSPPEWAFLRDRVVTLKWSDTPEVRDYLQRVTVDVRFGSQLKLARKLGAIVPKRLDGWDRVGPLESLAGGRPENDVVVKLCDPQVEKDAEAIALTIDREPIQIAGRLKALVTLIQPLEAGESDRFLVRHYDRETGGFDGPFEAIAIPQVSRNRQGVYPSTNRDLERSPFNAGGWYVYGNREADGIFVVEAIEPRALTRVQCDRAIVAAKAAIAHLRKHNWSDTPAKKGTGSAVLLDTTSDRAQGAIARWRKGDRAIVIHLFGGIGGQNAEPAPLGLVTGHFAYGFATAIEDSLTGELRFAIEYRQIYAHNREGIISGAIDWSEYMGNLRRGWLGLRPVSDILVKFETVTEAFEFDAIELSPIAYLDRELTAMCARYRTGDGTGVSLVDPASSCVQDSNQALYVTIKRLEEAIATSAPIQNWLARHLDHPQRVQLSQLDDLAKVLERNLVPFGIVQPDWRRNVERVAASRGSKGPIAVLLKTIATWRTLLPRRAHDEIAAILLKRGAALWILRTNQIGGFDPEILPEAPTALLGPRLR